MSIVFEIRFKEGDEIGHHLFVREHTTRVEEESRPTGRTVLVSNVPMWCKQQTLKTFFTRFGAIDNLQTQLKPGRQEKLNLDQMAGKFTGAVIYSFFILKKRLKRAHYSNTIFYIYLSYSIVHCIREEGIR